MNDEKIKITLDDIENNFPREPIIVSLDGESKKNNRRIISWIVASIIICFAVLSVFCIVKNNLYQTRQREAIAMVLQEDKNISQNLPKREATEVVSIVIRRMRAIDLSQCPNDFRDAYKQHIMAWEKAVPVLRQFEEQNGAGNILKSFLVGLIAGFTDQFHLVLGNIIENANASEELKQKAQKVDREIKDTFDEVLRIAKKYKIDISPYIN